jgi:hypothetical protein
MAVAPIHFPGMQVSSGGVDFSSLANLPQVYKQAQAEQVRRQTLAELGQGGTVDPMQLIRSGDMSLANLGFGIQQQQAQAARQAAQDTRQRERDAVTDKQNAAYLSIAQRNANRAEAAGPEQTATQRAKVAQQYGIQPGTPEFKAFVLNGELPKTVASSVEQRQAEAARAGMTPEHPAYQGFILTGKMPREDAQPLTATDKKAILEADEGVLSANTAIEALKKAKEISPKALGFRGAGTVASVGSVFGNETSQATVELDNTVTSNALSQLKAIFGGAPTEGERKILLDIQGSSGQPDAVRQKIYDRAIQMAQSRLKFNEDRAKELRGGTFYKGAKPAQAGGVSSSGALDEARAAIANGADRNAVIQRLIQNKINPGDL